MAFFTFSHTISQSHHICQSIENHVLPGWVQMEIIDDQMAITKSSFVSEDKSLQCLAFDELLL